MTLSLVTHTQLSNPILGQKIQTVEQCLNLIGTLGIQNHSCLLPYFSELKPHLTWSEMFLCA